MIDYKFKIGDIIGDVHQDQYLLIIKADNDKANRYLVSEDDLNDIWRYLKYGYKDIIPKYPWLEYVDYDFNTFGGMIVYYDEDVYVID